MSSRSRWPVSRPVLIGYCLMLACAAIAVLCTATAQASYFRMVLCAQGNDAWGLTTATNTASPANPGGIFIFQNQCTASGSYPAGDGAFMRIVDNQAAGSAGVGAYGAMSWTSPHAVAIAAAGGYTRVPNAFNDGWRGRFWAEGYDGSVNNILMQGAGVANGSCGGVCWATTPSFAPHLWAFGGYGFYRRFVFELNCVRQAGCDRTNFNAIDANTLVLTLNDVFPSRINLTNTESGILSGTWVRGVQPVTWNVSDEGSGMRFDRLRVDGGQRELIDWRGACNLDANGAVGEFARYFIPCPVGGPWGRVHQLNTATLTDGAHTVQACSQDYGQAVGISGSGGESCDQRQVRTDNNAPAAPGGLTIETANPARYLDTFGARWTLPPDPGSPITKVHYNVVDAEGKVVAPQKTVAATNPTKLEAVEGPKAPGDYRLRVWLEDQVGFVGGVATVAIPHDTTPPAAPQEVSITSPNTSRSDQGFDVRWRNITDAGAPIYALHYQVVNAAGGVVVPTKSLSAANPQAISNLETPKGAGTFALRLWLSDAEGNIGAPSEAPLSYECPRSDVAGGQTLSAGIGDGFDRQTVVAQGQGSKLGGTLGSPSGPVIGAALCVYSRVITDGGRDFLGIAMTGTAGSYSFPLAAGPSREISTIYRPDQRQIEAKATVLTRIKPTLKLVKKAIRNKQKAFFYGEIPGPHNDNVTVVLQVKSGKGWRAYRRYKTRFGGKFKVGYLFTQTRSRTVYEMRAQVRRTVGLPYEPGNSPTVRLLVRP
jgi:hypothetical protein